MPTIPPAPSGFTSHAASVNGVRLHWLGDKVLTMVKLVAKDASGETIADCGHFLPEEHPEVVLRHVQALRVNPQPMNIPNDHLAPSIP